MSNDIELIDSTRPPADSGREMAATRGRIPLVLFVVVAVVVTAVLSVTGSEEPSPPPNSIRPPAELPVDVAVGTVAGSGPVLDRETGLSLMAGGRSTPLRVLDLDTGDLTVSETMIEPRFVAGSSLVFRFGTRAWARAGVEGLRSGSPLDGTASSFQPDSEPAHVVPHDGGSVWLTWPASNRRRVWRLIDLATMSVIRDVATPPQARIQGGNTPFTGPEVIGFTTGGVHQLRGDGSYRQVLEGRLVAAGQDEVLVRQCPAASSCTLRWFERGTWAPLERPAPKGDLVNGRLVANDRLLAGNVARPAFGADLYDVESGERLRPLGPTPLGEVVVSPDGEWLLRRLFARVEVVEVATGTTVEVSSLPLGGDSVIWLESS